MTTTRLTQLPTEWVTGDTLARIMYDTCWYAWKQNAAIKDLVYTCCKFRPEDCRKVGVTLTPSVNKVTGAKRKNDMTVIIEKRLMLSISHLHHHHRALPSSSLPLRATLRSDRAHRRSTMHRAAAAGLDLGLGLGLGLASQGSLTSSTTTASSSPASQAHAQHWTAALNSVVGPQESYGLHPYANQQRKEEPGMRTSTSPESGVSAGTKRGLERTGSGVSRGGAAAGSDEDDDGGDGAGGRKKLRLSKDQAAVLEECFKTHSTLNPKQKTALANRLGLRPRQVEVWFQNRRARTKLKQTEVDCEYMKRWCEQLAEQNKRLEKEVAELRALKAAPAQQAAPAATLTMCPSCRRVAATTAGPSATQHQHQQPQQCHPKPNAHHSGNVQPSHCQFFPSTSAAAPDRSGRQQQGAWNGAAQPLVTRELF